jgi:hypothetical protein
MIFGVGVHVPMVYESHPRSPLTILYEVSTVANRTQKLVLSFIALAWVSLVAILATAPEIYDQVLKLPNGGVRLAELGFLVAITVFIAFLSIGVLRRWRWAFWLIVVAFLFGVLRVPASALQLTGVLPAAFPSWYVLLQALLGLVQFTIGILMLVVYRRAGIWGAF